MELSCFVCFMKKMTALSLNPVEPNVLPGIHSILQKKQVMNHGFEEWIIQPNREAERTRDLKDIQRILKNN